MRVPVNDLKRQNHAMAAELTGALQRVQERGWYILGPEVEAFEAEFAGFCGTPHCAGLASGTDALELALRALGVGPGDEVATVANAGSYSTTAILAAGARPVYVDVEYASMTMDPGALAGALTAATKAVIVTHLYGRMGAVEQLLAVASRHGLPLIEDCAQAHGAALGGRKAGAWGALGCFSFYPTKNLGALGDAGAVVTSDASLDQRVRRLRQYGWTSRYRSTLAGGRNSRLDELQAAVLRAKLPHLDEWNRRRRDIASQYAELLAGSGLLLPGDVSGAHYVAHLYVVRTPRRDELRARLAGADIDTDIHYPVPEHQQEAVRPLGLSGGGLAVTERCCREVLTLPCFAEITDAEVRRVAAAIGQCRQTG